MCLLAPYYEGGLKKRVREVYARHTKTPALNASNNENKFLNKGNVKEKALLPVIAITFDGP
jgi:hypothetical protein